MPTQPSPVNLTGGRGHSSEERTLQQFALHFSLKGYLGKHQEWWLLLFFLKKDSSRVAAVKSPAPTRDLEISSPACGEWFPRRPISGSNGPSLCQPLGTRQAPSTGPAEALALGTGW